MDQLWNYLWDLIKRPQETLGQLVATYHLWTYLILFVVIFCETGLVVTPFLPGDSLLFATGAITASAAASSGAEGLNILWLFAMLSAAAVLGDTANYWIGKLVGPKVFHKEKVRFLNREHLKRAHRFYEKYGGKTIIIARFVPIIRTFAPFVAGIGTMSYPRFIAFNVIGGVAWIALFLFTGYWFGNIEWVQKRFHAVIVAIIIISLLPPVIEYIRARRERARKA